MMDGAANMMKELSSMGESAREKQAATMKQLMSCKNMNDITEITTKISQETMEDTMSMATKLSESTIKLCMDSAEPLNDTMSKTMQTMKKKNAKAA